MKLKELINIFDDNIEFLLAQMLWQNNIKLEDLKHGDLKRITTDDKDVEYYTIYGRLCYKFERVYTPYSIESRLTPAQEYLENLK